MTSTDYSPLIERIKKRITTWTARQLSFAGRLQLIGSVIYSLTSFWMSVYRLPKQCIKEIDQLCSAFLWSGPAMSSKKAKISWENVCKPKEEGGLGLRSLTETNRVCCLKLIWRILSQTTLWVMWIKRYLIRKGSFWSIKETSSLGSWMWKKLLKYRDLARSFTTVAVRSGVSTSFWFDNWSPLGRIYELTGAGGCVALGISLNATVEHVVQHYRSRRHRSEHLIVIDIEIMKLRNQGLTDEDDEILWRGKGDIYKPEFHTSQTWHLTRLQQPTISWYKGVWFSGATPKYSVLSWLAAHNRLATGDRLLQWNAQANASCVFCNLAMETRDHLFFGCHYSEEIWRNLTRKLLGQRYTYEWSRILELVSTNVLSSTNQFLLRYVFQALVHTIWLERNGRRHGSPHQDRGTIIMFVDKQVRNRVSSLRRKGGKHLSQAMANWFDSRA